MYDSVLSPILYLLSTRDMSTDDILTICFYPDKIVIILIQCTYCNCNSPSSKVYLVNIYIQIIVFKIESENRHRQQ